MENTKVKSLTKDEKKQIREQAKKLAMSETKVEKDDVKAFEEALNEIRKPIVLKDKDIVIQEGELDVRQLSDASFRQILYRCETIKIATLRSLDKDLVDMMKLQMLTLKKLGVQDIEEEMSKLMNELKETARKHTKA